MNIRSAALHLSKIIQFNTISYNDEKKFNKKEFLSLHTFLKKTYPKVHKSLKKETIHGLSLLYTWKGNNIKSNPIILLAHQDVVPAENIEKWEYPPFSGKIADEYIWGRGTLDIKCNIIAIMEAVEYLISIGFKPERTVYIAFGHDEEVIGIHGAAKISEILEQRGVRAAYILDEGGMIVTETIPGIKKPVALVGIAEKGYISLELKVQDKGGHSSVPPKHTAVGKLATAIHRLEKNPFPLRLKGSKVIFDYINSYISFPHNIILTNLWIIKPLMGIILPKYSGLNALLRTTTAATMFEGSSTENILPQQAKATINVRIIPGETRDTVIKRIKKIINNLNITIHSLNNSNEPSPVSDVNSKEFAALHKIITDLFPDVIVAPTLLLGRTDSRYFTNISNQIFRFSPVRLNPEDSSRIHGTNERISIKNLENIINFYIRIIQDINEHD